MNAAQHLVLDPLRSARQLIPNARIEIIPTAHHVAAVANPGKVNQKLLEFFAE